MKKFIIIIFLFVLILGFSGCEQKPEKSVVAPNYPLKEFFLRRVSLIVCQANELEVGGWF